ncbi:hypothetical protein F5Y07DRAFT_376629 [Xylaria sp. FL0933]|nr:hypothetical protein F5Y07DRAFT_376629 [Xylaria sp. FL0933]
MLLYPAVFSCHHTSHLIPWLTPSTALSQDIPMIFCQPIPSIQSTRGRETLDYKDSCNLRVCMLSRVELRLMLMAATFVDWIRVHHDDWTQRALLRPRGSKSGSWGGCRMCAHLSTAQYFARSLYYFLRLERFEGERRAIRLNTSTSMPGCSTGTNSQSMHTHEVHAVSAAEATLANNRLWGASSPNRQCCEHFATKSAVRPDN